jgi:hypothetical protein
MSAYWDYQQTSISEKRLNKLRTIAASREKTITQMVEEWIDRLSNPSID